MALGLRLLLKISIVCDELAIEVDKGKNGEMSRCESRIGHSLEMKGALARVLYHLWKC